MSTNNKLEKDQPTQDSAPKKLPSAINIRRYFDDIAQDRGDKPSTKSSPYKLDIISKIPAPLKAIFLKFWFAGAIYYFMGWGIFSNTTDQLDITVAIGFIIGIVTDLIVNRIFELVDNSNGDMRRYALFYHKKFYFLFFNIAYGLVLSLLIAYTYNTINYLVITMKGLPKESVVLGAEPLLYGVFFLVYDFVFLGFKNLCAFVVNKIRTRL